MIFNQIAEIGFYPWILTQSIMPPSRLMATQGAERGVARPAAAGAQELPGANGGGSEGFGVWWREAKATDGPGVSEISTEHP